MSTNALPSTHTAIPATVRLDGRKDWHDWFLQCRIHARWQGIWKKIDPEARDAPNVALAPPRAPTIQQLTNEENERRTNLYEERYEAWSNLAEDVRGNEPNPPAVATKKEIELKYDNARKDYTVRATEWSAQSTRYTAMWNWISATVNKALLMSALTELELLHPKEDPSIQRLLRILQKQLAPSSESVEELIRQQYNAILEKALTGTINPDTWFQEWQEAYVRARSRNIPEIQGQQATRRFLLAIKARINPPWADQQLMELARCEALGKPALSLEEHGTWFSVMLQQEERKDPKSVFSTLGGRSDSRGHTCPCLKSLDHRHPWKPQECRALKYAVLGIKDDKLKDPPDESECAQIRTRMSFSRYKSLREELQVKEEPGPYPTSVVA